MFLSVSFAAHDSWRRSLLFPTVGYRLCWAKASSKVHFTWMTFMTSLPTCSQQAWPIDWSRVGSMKCDDVHTAQVCLERHFAQWDGDHFSLVSSKYPMLVLLLSSARSLTNREMLDFSRHCFVFFYHCWWYFLCISSSRVPQSRFGELAC